MIELEKNCPKCNGDKMVITKWFDGEDRQVYCTDCNATGKVPSEDGQAILNFLCNYLRVDMVNPGRLYHRKGSTQ